MSDLIGDALRADAVAYWTMNEASNTTRLDSTVNGHDLLQVGNVPQSTGKVQGAAGFTVAAENGLRIIGDDSFVNLCLTTITFSGWAKIDDFDPAQEDHTIIYATNNGNIEIVSVDYILFFNTNNDGNPNAIGIVAYDAEGSVIVFHVHSVLPTEGEWFFFVFTVDPGAESASLTINTTKESSSFLSTPANLDGGGGTSKSFSVGSEVGFNTPNLATNQINGSIDEVGVWHRVLSDDEIDYLYNNGAGRTLFGELSIGVNADSAEYRTKGVRIYP